MPEISLLHPLPLPDGHVLTASARGDRLLLALDDAPLVSLRSEADHLQCVEVYGGDAKRALWSACYWLFAHQPDTQRLYWTGLELDDDVVGAALHSGLLQLDDQQQLLCERQAFWQLAKPWQRGLLAADYPQQMIMTTGKRHPRRPPKPLGEVYRRFDARLQAWVSLRTLDIDTDLTRFSRWQNSARVMEFWQEGGSLEQHREYLQKLAVDPHTVTLIGCIDDEPFAYFEAYWAKEDRIAPFYAAGDHDRGIHMLVGEEHHRGPHKVAAWLAALVHWLYLDDPRTCLVVAEPRADNGKMIGHMQRLGFYREKEFDFPHKRAALMAISRETFFDRGPLC
ncbi:GNAT family N-acetyltransferase [Pseudomonas sp.]|uniref:GNAT family N-acetyltransferase n=1 Tax=Pseudomonas sp. TaxID=306 RepID=UPI002602AADB|nr:GNAT family N-acetyltransferase [Pseudomonas sp.]